MQQWYMSVSIHDTSVLSENDTVKRPAISGSEVTNTKHMFALHHTNLIHQLGLQFCTPAHTQLNTLNIHTVRLSPHYLCSQAVFTASVNSTCEHGPQTWVSKMTPMLDTSVHNPRTRVVSADP